MCISRVLEHFLALIFPVLKMDDIVDKDDLKDTYPYFDNITIGGYDKVHLSRNVNAFLNSLKKRGI